MRECIDEVRWYHTVLSNITLASVTPSHSDQMRAGKRVSRLERKCNVCASHALAHRSACLGSRWSFASVDTALNRMKKFNYVPHANSV